MDRGDVLLIDGQRYIVQGVDPSGSTPRLVYLENCDTHERSFVDFEDVDARNVVRPRLRLIRGEGEQFGDRRER